MTTNFDPSSLARALSLASEYARTGPAGRDAISAQIERISYELGEISKMLVGSFGGGKMPAQCTAVGSLDHKRELPSRVQLAIRARLERANHFPPGIFADPAWDMLLDLFQSELLQRRTTVTDLCTASQVPQSTALRWMATLTELGLIVRRPDPLDGRRIYIELTNEGRQSLYSYFDSVPTDTCHETE